MTNRDDNYEIYTMDPDGSDQTRIPYAPSFEIFPVWSPDGRYIACHSVGDGNFEVYVIDAETKIETWITNDPA